MFAISFFCKEYFSFPPFVAFGTKKFLPILSMYS